MFRSETVLEDVGINADSDSETEEEFEGFSPEELLVMNLTRDL